MKIFIIYVFCFCGGFCAVAQPGFLDSNFGDSGKTVNITFKGPPSSLTTQQDGKILMVGNGFTLDQSGEFWLVARYNTDGNLDNNFGNNGIVAINGSEIGALNINGSSLAVQKDNKIIAGGNFSFLETNYDIALVRYNEDGSLDNSFGVNGIAINDLGAKEITSDIALQEDGKILVTGTSSGDEESSFIARYMPDGSLDESFGNHGIVNKDYGHLVYFNTLTLQKDGKILAAGYEHPFKNNDIIVRYLSNGSVDSSFGENGISRLFFSGRDWGFANIFDITVQDDGKIVTAGSSGSNKDLITVARFDSNGKIDSGFATNGIYVSPDKETQSRASSIMIQENKKILVAGAIEDDVNSFMAFRFTADGIPDSSFGENGIAGTNIDENDGIGTCGSLQQDGKIIVAGLFYIDNIANSALVRFNGDPTHPLLTKIKKWIRKHILNFEDTNPNAAYYTIEKSTDGKGFEEIGRIKANAESKINQKQETRNNSYSFLLPPTRNEKPETICYRIKTVNKDNSFSYTDAITDDESTTQQINKSTNQQIRIYPNPAKARIYIQSTKEVILRLQNSFGQIIITQKIKGSGSMDVSKLPNGIYYVVNAESGESFKVVKE